MAELKWLGTLPLRGVHFGKIGDVIRSALCRALVTVAAFWVRHLTSSLGIGLLFGAED